MVEPMTIVLLVTAIGSFVSTGIDWLRKLTSKEPSTETASSKPLIIQESNTVNYQPMVDIASIYFFKMALYLKIYHFFD